MYDKVEDENDYELALALELSTGTLKGIASGGSPSSTQPEQKAAPFRYGTDYPRPIITAVSLRSAEESEAQARRAQAVRDRQIEAAKQRRLPPSSATSRSGQAQRAGPERTRPRWGGERPAHDVSAHCVAKGDVDLSSAPPAGTREDGMDARSRSKEMQVATREQRANPRGKGAPGQDRRRRWRPRGSAPQDDPILAA